MPTPLLVAVVGGGAATATRDDETDAEDVGRLLAEAGAIVVCGGLGGVMAAACRGAVAAGGTTLGLLPGLDPAAANPWVTVPVATGLGELRNGLVVRAAAGVVAIGGGHGTLSEVALACKAGTPVVGLRTWDVAGVVVAPSAADAVALVLART